mgnify:CR=1 FL=1
MKTYIKDIFFIFDRYLVFSWFWVKISIFIQSSNLQISKKSKYAISKKSKYCNPNIAISKKSKYLDYKIFIFTKISFIMTSKIDPRFFANISTKFLIFANNLYIFAQNCSNFDEQTIFSTLVQELIPSIDINDQSKANYVLYLFDFVFTNCFIEDGSSFIGNDNLSARDDKLVRQSMMLEDLFWAYWDQKFKLMSACNNQRETSGEGTGAQAEL